MVSIKLEITVTEMFQTVNGLKFRTFLSVFKNKMLFSQNACQEATGQTASSLGLHCLSRHSCCCPLVFEISEHLPYIFLNHEFCSLHAGQFCMLFVVFDFFQNILLGRISSQCQTV